MLARATPILGSLAAVVAAFLVYRFTAVLLIEPGEAPRAHRASTEEGVEQASLARRNQLQRLEPLFEPGDWELDHPIVLETDNGKLLFGSYSNLENGDVEIKPCTMVFLPADPTADAETQRRRAVVLRAPQGAVLQFDEPFDPKRARIGKLVRGKLLGGITIHGRQRLPGPEDDLLIVTRDVELSQNQIFTPHPVQFRLGRNHGSGLQMRITLIPKEEGPGTRSGPSFGGIRTFELIRNVKMHLEADSLDLATGASETPRAAAENRLGAENAPVEITCQGPFRFDMEKYVATFSRQVDVVQVHPNGPSDQLTSELLSLFFEPRADGDAASDGKVPKLTPRRIEAEGNPVVVRAPSRGVEARGQKLVYDLTTGAGSLTSEDEVVVRCPGDEIHARQLHFEPDETKQRIRQFLAIGPGWLRAGVPDRAGEALFAQWNDEARYRPSDGQQVISVTGRAQVEMTGMGRLEADEMHAWLLEAADGASLGGGFGYTPQRMLAEGDVRIDSPKLTGSVGRLEVWFESPARPAPSVAATTSVPGGALAQNHGPGQNLDGTAPMLGSVASTAGATAEESRQRFDIAGDLLRLQVVVDDPQPRLSEVIVQGAVRLNETRTSAPNEEPMRLTGDRLHLLQTNPTAATVVVTGQPAHVEMRGLSINGEAIHLDRGANRLWIDGAGSMIFPIDQDVDGAPLPGAGVLDVAWRGRMHFDGRRAVFEREVEARQPNQVLRTNSIDVNLTNLVPFAGDSLGRRPEVESIVCGGGVFMVREEYTEGRLTGVQKMQTPDLTINAATGQISASGPGWVRTVRTGSSDLTASLDGAAQGNASRPAPDAGATEGRTYLGVNYDRALGGNFRNRSLEFHGHVRAVHGPVNDWHDVLSPDDPDRLGADGLLLTTNRLTVSQMGGRGPAQPTWFELEAFGNTDVEGRSFSAWAQRMTYTQAKDLIVLEGDGRSDAQLYRQDRVGGPHQKAFARKIMFWRATRRVRVEGPSQLDLSQLPGQRDALSGAAAPK